MARNVSNQVECNAILDCIYLGGVAASTRDGKACSTEVDRYTFDGIGRRTDAPYFGCKLREVTSDMATALIHRCEEAHRP